tara:strand:+ start:258 stop:1025 length:768 start_codon:yes stop_codon:yes gene_type:complete
MKLKTNWKLYVENLRKREIEIILPYLTNRNIINGLEIGAGSGFQSRILTKYIDNLYCTELNDQRLIKKQIDGIHYIIADAEMIDSNFKTEYFDFVFSSNLFEHLPSPQKAIRGLKKVLGTNGITIHIIPSPFNVIVRLLLWYPNLIVSSFDYIFSQKILENRSKKSGNNIKLNRTNPKLKRLLIPQPHGVSRNIFSEIGDMNKKKWISQFEKEKLTIIKVIKGPVASGYGFGFNMFRRVCEKMGLASEFIYIFKK